MLSPHISLPHLNRPSTGDLVAHSVEAWREEMSYKMTHTQTQDSFLRHNSQGTLAVLSPSPYSREEIGSHKYMPVAPWSLSLGNERKHSITIFLELCPHGRDSSVLSFLLRYDPHFKKNMFRESYQQAYLVFWANQKRKLTSKKEKCRRIIACHRT